MSKKSSKLSKENGKLPFITIFGVSAVCFGIHVGGGFATGNQTVNFFVKYGWTAVFLPIIAIAIHNLVFREALIFAQRKQVYDYKSWANAAFGKYRLVLSTIFEIAYCCILILAASGSIAGAAVVLQGCGIAYALGVLIIGMIVLFLTVFGTDVLAKASSAMTVVMTISILLFCIICLGGRGGNLAEIVTTRYNPTAGAGFGTAVWMMLQYVGYQAYTGAIISPYAKTLQNRRNVNRMVAFNFIINAGLLTLTAILLTAWLPEILGQTLPMVYIAEQVGKPWLMYLYTITLLLAQLSTAAGCIFGMVPRFEQKVFQSKPLLVRRITISSTCMIAAMLISFVGLDAIVSVGFAYTGIVGIFIMIIPTIFVIGYQNRKAAREEKAKPVAQPEEVE